MIKLYILGSGSGVPTKKRYPTSIVLSADENIYLFDCGEPCSSLLIRKGIPHKKIKSVFISHMDPDHSSGIFMLIQLMELTGRKAPLKIFVPEEAINGLNESLKTFYLFYELLHFKLEIFSIKESGLTYEDKHLILFAYPNKHLRNRLKQKYSHLKLESYSFLIKIDKKRIAYSGDIAKPEDLEPLLRQDIDLLITEMAHFKPDELFSYLCRKKIDRIFLTHIHPDLGDKEKELEEMGNKYIGKNKVFVAYDGLKTGV